MNKLFDEFESVSAKAWKQKIQVDLKGADYNDTLIWKSPEGINVKPFYHADDFSNPILNSVSKAREWTICQSIFVSNTIDANKKAIDILDRGAESLNFVISNEDISLEHLLQNINLSITPIYLQIEFLSDNFLKKILKLESLENIFLNIDIIGNLARSGNWFNDIKKDHEILDTVLSSKQNLASVISVDMSLYQNAGANMVQQLAYGLAHANEYLNHFNDKLKQAIVFKVSVGTNYFFEIAKIRALKTLFHSIIDAYDCDIDCHIIVTPTKRNKTLYDYNTNMLRTTTECMSAILGSANSICNLPYDAIYHKDNEFGERIARNQLLILKHESYFNLVDNPSDGTYYIEKITNELSEKALVLFKDIEANGGFLKQLKEGIIQRKLKESNLKEQQDFDEGNITLLGTNKHPNTNDKMKHNLEIYPFVKTNKRKTLIEPILEKRLAEKSEQERINNE